MFKKKMWGWIALLALGFQGQLSPQATDALDAKLNAPLQNYQLEESSLLRAQVVVASHFEIPMGIEWIEPATPRPIKLSWKQTTVWQVIRSIASTQGDYEVERGSVVHVLYRGAKSDKSNFLNIRLAQFDVKNQYIARALLNLHDEVNSRMTATPPPKDWFGHYFLEPNDQRLSIEFKQATVRDILDRLVLLSGRPIWAVTFRPEAGLTAAGFLRTISSLWGSSAIPDNNQPGWDRMMWGKELPTPNWGPNANEGSAEKQ